MSVTVGELLIKMSIETGTVSTGLQQVQQQASQAGNAINNQLAPATEHASQTTAALSERTLGLGQALNVVSPGLGNMVNTLMQIGSGVAVVGGIALITKSIWDVGEAGARLQDVIWGFGAMAEGAGVSGDAVVTAMDKAARGTIDDSDLMLMANQAWLKGLELSADQMAQAMEVARVRAKVMGTDTASTYSNEMFAIMSAMPRALRQFGVQDFDVQVENYAKAHGKLASAVTDSERHMLAFNAIVGANAPLVSKAGDAALTNAEKIDQMGAAIQDSREKLELLIAPMVGSAAAGITTSINSWTSAFGNLAIMLAIVEKVWPAGLKGTGATPKAIFGDLTKEALRAGSMGGLVDLYDFVKGLSGGAALPTAGADISTMPSILAALGINAPLPPGFGSAWATIGSGGGTRMPHGDQADGAYIMTNADKAAAEVAKRIKADEDATKASKDFANAMMKAGQDVHDKMESLLNPTAPTALDLQRAKLGMPTETHWDELARRAQAALEGGPQNEWAKKMFPGQSGDQLKKSALEMMDAVYNFDFSKLPPGTREQMAASITAEYNKGQKVEAGKESVLALAGVSTTKMDVGTLTVGTITPGKVAEATATTGALTTGGAAAASGADLVSPLVSTTAAQVKARAKEIQAVGEAFMGELVNGAGRAASGMADVLLNVLMPGILTETDWRYQRKGALP